MRKDNFNLPRNTRKARKLPIRRVITVIIIFLALSFIMGYIWNSLKDSDFFKIKYIITRNADSGIELSYLKGKNIFDLVLKEEAGYILDSCPNCSKVNIIRLFPDRLFVDFVKRKPAAFVKLYRYFAVDEKGVFFLVEEQPEDLGLPIITGLETKIFGPKPGKRYGNKELLLALDIVRASNRSRVLRTYRIKRIDISSPLNASMYISLAGPVILEAKIGAENIAGRISTLAGLFLAARSDLVNIKYIDLRFKEPVIKFRDAKR